MKRSLLHKVNLMLLASALIFGQVGAGFFHNQHDAHEAVIDLDHTVLVEHGEHCKICSVDWLNQFLIPNLEFPAVETDHNVDQTFFSYPPSDHSQSRTRDRAPPIVV